MEHYECIIIGQGPSGISCAIYAVRANIKCLVIAKDGGALEKTHALENYYGFVDPIAGPDLLKAGLMQAERLKVPMIKDEVTSIQFGDNCYEISTQSGNKYSADCIFLGLGASRTTPPLKNLANLEGKGVSYCAVCDGFFYRQKNVAVIGKGAYALHEAEELAAVVDKVTIFTNGEEPEVDFSNFTVVKEKIKEISGTDAVEGIVLKNDEQIPVQGIFMAIGTAGGSDFAKKLGLELAGKKLVVDADCQTNLPGIYAGGDVTEGIMQVARAVSNGAVAAQHIIKTIREKRKNNK